MFKLLKNPNIIIKVDRRICKRANGDRVMNATMVITNATPSFKSKLNLAIIMNGYIVVLVILS